MKITKLGHCCLLIETKKLRILTDPGQWTTAQNELKDIDMVLITHEHPDHLHIESVQKIVANNPKVVIYTNSGVGALLDTAGVKHALLEKGTTTTVENVLIESIDFQHEEIYKGIPLPQNTGYVVDTTLLYPGDAFGNPKRAVPVLALPVCGPWMKISQAIDYAKTLRPETCFPVHDGMLGMYGPFHTVPQSMLKKEGIAFIPLAAGGVLEV